MLNSSSAKVTIICSANQLTGFYMMATLSFNELILRWKLCDDLQQKQKKLGDHLILAYAEKNFVRGNYFPYFLYLCSNFLRVISAYWLDSTVIANEISSMADMKVFSQNNFPTWYNGVSFFRFRISSK